MRLLLSEGCSTIKDEHSRRRTRRKYPIGPQVRLSRGTMPGRKILTPSPYALWRVVGPGRRRRPPRSSGLERPAHGPEIRPSVAAAIPAYAAASLSSR